MLALLALLPPNEARAQAAADSVFAPVEARQQAREAMLGKAGAVSGPERVELLLEAGHPDQAAELLRGLGGDPRRLALARARVHIARYELEAARPLAEAILALPDPTDSERQLGYQWLFVIDDAARVDSLTRRVSLAGGASPPLPDLLAAGRLAYDMLRYDRATACYERAIALTAPVKARGKRAGLSGAAHRGYRAAALRGLGVVLQKKREYDRSLAVLTESVGLDPVAENVIALAETFIRLGQTDRAITAAEWTVRLDPYHETGHYLLGNGYARKSYRELEAARPESFADAAGDVALAEADGLLARGDRARARAAYESLERSRPAWVDVAMRLASLDFEDRAYGRARQRCFAALERCPEYGRAHGTLSKALEAQRFEADVHRPGYEARFAAAPTPDIPGIERFVSNWKSLSPRHQKRVALSIEPWAHYIPVLVEGGATYFIKPLWMKLSECPGLETLEDQRIDYDSRLWDDVRGAGGYHTVTGLEDVERTIFDRYNTVLHELSHQVHAVLTSDQSREIQEHYRMAKARDDATRNGYLSRYAGGSVYEYFAEGANALYSPMRDAYDPREVVRERLDTIDPALRRLIEGLIANRDVSASYPVAYVNAGDDRVSRGEVDRGIPYYLRALQRSPREETALASLTNAYVLKGAGASAVAAAERARLARPESGTVMAAVSQAYWYGGRGLDRAIDVLAANRASVRREDRYRIDQTLGQMLWNRGSAERALATFDSVIAYQSDNPEGLWGRASSLALAGRWDEAIPAYDKAVRMRTGIAALRCDYARDLLRAGRLDAAGAQLDEARLLDPENPTAEALRGWLAFERGATDSARAHLDRAMKWGPRCDLARIVLGGVEQAAGNPDAARAAWKPVRDRIARNAAPGYVYRKAISTWEPVHQLPAVERELLGRFERAEARGAVAP